MEWQEYIELSTNAAGEEAQSWGLDFVGEDAARVIESAVNHIFRNAAFNITPEQLGRAYLDASTDFSNKKPTALGKVVYIYASKLANGESK